MNFNNIYFFSFVLIFAFLKVFTVYRLVKNKSWPYVILLYLVPFVVFVIGHITHTIGYSIEQEELKKLIESGEEVLTFNDVRGSFANFVGIWIKIYSIPILFFSFGFTGLFILNQFKKSRNNY